MKEWTEELLGNIAPYSLEKISSKELNEENYISTDNMLANKNGITSSVYPPKLGKYNSFKPDDILVSNIRPYFKKIWFADKIGGCSNDILVFRVDHKKLKEVDTKFIYYCLSGDNFFSHMMAGSSGTKMPRGNKKSILKFKIRLPKFEIQNKISQILSDYDSSIDNNNKRIKLLEENAVYFYEEYFKRFIFNGKKLVIDKKTKLPVGWTTIKVSSLLEKIKVTKKIKSNKTLNVGKIPVVDQGIDFISGYTNEEDIHHYTGKPFIVFGDHTRILKFIDFSFARGADGTQVLVSNNSRMPQTLFYQSLKSLNLPSYHYARHFKFLKAEEIILPDALVAKSYDDKCKVIFELIKNLRNQNILLKEARDIILPRIMNNVIKV